MSSESKDNPYPARGQRARPIGVRPDPAEVDEKPDPRLVAFGVLIDAIDSRDWRLGQQATKRLRALGLSVCTCTPAGPGGGA